MTSLPSIAAPTAPSTERPLPRAPSRADAAVLNVHERLLQATPAEVGALLDTLASPSDQLWPYEQWPRLRFDRPLAIGAVGGHGPIRYEIVAYDPGRLLRFRFLGPRGFAGTHELEAIPAGSGTLLRHVIAMTPIGGARITWPLVFEPLHDALLEDAFDKAEQALTRTVARPARWSLHVRALRRILGRYRRNNPKQSRAIDPARRLPRDG